MIDALEYAQLSKNAYRDHDKDGQAKTIVGGTYYRVIDSISSPSGYQATAYQKTDTGEVIIAHRGTEADKISGDLWLDGAADLDMVRDGKNSQLDDAMNFTARVIAQVKASETRIGQPIDISTTGHSLGGTLAEITAYRFGLRGETFNSYGAADLGYGVPEGGTQVINHVRASDVVSAASRHFGAMRVYATEQDLALLQRGQTLDPHSAAHSGHPLLNASLSAHIIDNFAPDAGNGTSILSTANELRYRDSQLAFDRYRQAVAADRATLGTLLRRESAPEMGFTPHTRSLDADEHLAATLPVSRQMDAIATTAQISSELIHGVASAAAIGMRIQASAVSLHADELAAKMDAASNSASLISGRLASVSASAIDADPVGSVEAMAGIQLTGYVVKGVQAAAAQLTQKTGQALDAALRTSADVTEGKGHWLRVAGQTIAEATQRGARTAGVADLAASQQGIAALDPLKKTARQPIADTNDAVAQIGRKFGVGLAPLIEQAEKPITTFAEATQGLGTGLYAATPYPRGAIASEPNPASQESNNAAQSRSEIDLSARLDRLLTSNDSETFRRETRALADLPAGRALRIEADARVGVSAARQPQSAERANDAGGLER